MVVGGVSSEVFEGESVDYADRVEHETLLEELGVLLIPGQLC